MGTVHRLEHGTGQHAHQYTYGRAGSGNDSSWRRRARRSRDGANDAGGDTGSKQDAIGKRHDLDANQQTAGTRNHSCWRGCGSRNQRQPREGGRTGQPED